ncbi:MAG: TIGR04282 family arsenosugar biosynthesis glycosyltransferase [Spirosomaceae bacterium]|nr:TIGR04282 family arsenosugar biosynthesis glycosyltransferase [Spirosomataceae bacterium]
MDSLIIFIKNPELGKVKTRLAATVGDEKALDVYCQLLKHTRNTTQPLPIDKHLFYSSFIDEDDMWAEDVYSKHLQTQTNDLGQKMYDAFMFLHDNEYEKVVIIGSDCLDLDSNVLREAYVNLAENDAVVGPATDGGYYAIGFNFEKIEKDEEVLKKVFLNKDWSHENVAQEAIDALEQLGLKIHILPELNDVDFEEDAKELL